MLLCVFQLLGILFDDFKSKQNILVYSLCSCKVLISDFLYVVETIFSYLILLTADANSFAVQHSSLFNCCHHLHISSASSELLWPRNDSQAHTFRVAPRFFHRERQREFKMVLREILKLHCLCTYLCYVLNLTLDFFFSPSSGFVLIVSLYTSYLARLVCSFTL